MPIYCNLGGGQRQIASIQTNKDNSKSELLSAYSNISGANKQIFSKLYRWIKYTYTKTSSYKMSTDTYSSTYNGSELVERIGDSSGSVSYDTTFWISTSIQSSMYSSPAVYLSNPSYVDFCYHASNQGRNIYFKPTKETYANSNVPISGYWVIVHSSYCGEKQIASLNNISDGTVIARRFSYLYADNPVTASDFSFDQAMEAVKLYQFTCATSYLESTDPNAYSESSWPYGVKYGSLGSDVYCTSSTSSSFNIIKKLN